MCELYQCCSATLDNRSRVWKTLNLHKLATVKLLLINSHTHINVDHEGVVKLSLNGILFIKYVMCLRYPILSTYKI